MSHDLTSRHQFTPLATEPVSRSANPVSADAAKSRVAEILLRLKESLIETHAEAESDSAHRLPSDATISQAESFALSLHAFTLPLVMCLDDGGICFQWSKDGNGILTAALYGDGALVFVARFGPMQRARGTVPLKPDGLPEPLLVWLKTYFMPSSKQPWMNTSTTMSY